MCGIVVSQCACLSKYASVFVFQYYTPRIFMYFNSTVSGRVGEGLIVFAHLPRIVVAFGYAAKHNVLSVIVLWFNGSGEHCDANGSRTDKAHLEFQLRVVVVCRFWEVKHL